MQRRFIRILGPVLTLLLFSAAVWVLYRELHQYHLHQVIAEIGSIARRRALASLAWCVASYVLLTGYDALACHYIHQRLPYRRIAMTSFIAYSFSHNLGAAFISGGSVRYRLYSEWGLSAVQVTLIVVFGGVTLTLGALAAGGAIVLWRPLRLPAQLSLGWLPWRAIAAVLLAAAAAYIAACAVRTRPLRLWKWELPVPSLKVALLQLLLGSADWLLAAAAFYELLPRHAASFALVLQVFMLALVAGLLSHVPGGLGVFETVALLLLSPSIEPHRIFSALLAFRVIYFLLPLTIAAPTLAVHEILLRRRRGQRPAAAGPSKEQSDL